jgi:hypothetical protein
MLAEAATAIGLGEHETRATIGSARRGVRGDWRHPPPSRADARGQRRRGSEDRRGEADRRGRRGHAWPAVWTGHPDRRPARRERGRGGPGRRPVDGAAVLDQALGLLRKFCVLPSTEAAHAVVLWIAATHALPALPAAPRLRGSRSAPRW